MSFDNDRDAIVNEDDPCEIKKIHVVDGTMEFNKHPGPEVFTIKYKPGTPILDDLRKLDTNTASRSRGQPLKAEAEKMLKNSRQAEEQKKGWSWSQLRRVSIGRGGLHGGLAAWLWSHQSSLDPASRALIRDRSGFPSWRASRLAAGLESMPYGAGEEGLVSMQRHGRSALPRLWFVLIVFLGLARSHQHTCRRAGGNDETGLRSQRPLHSAPPRGTPRHARSLGVAAAASAPRWLLYGRTGSGVAVARPSLEGVRFAKGDRALDRPAIVFVKDSKGGHFGVLRPVGTTGNDGSGHRPSSCALDHGLRPALHFSTWTGRILLPRDPWYVRYSMAFVIVGLVFPALSLSVWRLNRSPKPALMLFRTPLEVTQPTDSVPVPTLVSPDARSRDGS